MTRPRWLYAVAVFVGVIMVTPPLVVIPMSFSGERTLTLPPPSFSTRWYEEFFTNPIWVTSLRSSIEIALLVTVVSLILGTLASMAIVRGTFRGRRIIETFGIAPIVVPVVILGLGMYAAFLEWGLVGSRIGFVAAHTILAVPFVIITVTSSLRVQGVELEKAAAVLGAAPWRVFRRVTLPLIAPGMFAGGLFAFVTSFDEVVISLFISDPKLRTLPVQMYASVTRDINPTIAAASTLILVFSTILILFATRFIFREPPRVRTGKE